MAQRETPRPRERLLSKASMRADMGHLTPCNRAYSLPGHVALDSPRGARKKRKWRTRRDNRPAKAKGPPPIAVAKTTVSTFDM